MDRKVTGSLQEKKGLWYCVLNLYINGERKQKWISTKLPVKNNKTKAQDMLAEMKTYYNTVSFPSSTEEGEEDVDMNSSMDFTEYLKVYLSTRRHDIARDTYEGYESYIRRWERYCKDKKKSYKLRDIKELTIKNFYNYLMDDGCKQITINHYMGLFNPALKYAYKHGYIWHNPTEDMHRYPKDKTFKGTFYSPEECSVLLDKLKNDKLGLFFKTSLYLGTRCSETLGIRFENIDFEKNLIHICHKVLYKSDNNLTKSDILKTSTSNRYLPLPEELKKEILIQKQKIESNINKGGYWERDKGYLFVDEKGCLYRNAYCSTYSRKWLKKNKLRHMRLHDYRHTTASLLSMEGTPLVDIKDFLGHAEIEMTTKYAQSNLQQIIKAGNVLSSLLDSNKTSQDKTKNDDTKQN